MRSALQELLTEKTSLLADGATGTNFMEMGLAPGFPPDSPPAAEGATGAHGIRRR